MGKETYTAWIGKKKYVFNMTNHMKGNFAQNCEEIANWIHEHRDNLINDWALLGPLRFNKIGVSHPLFTLLEDNIQQHFPWNNWLIFAGNPFDDLSNVTVTHFGPLGFKNQKETEGNFAKVQQILMEYVKSVPQSQIDLKDYSKIKVHKFSVSNLVFKDYSLQNIFCSCW
jgi:hypothetical protein